MEESKFYIPNIEEIHVGFRAQVKLNSGDWKDIIHTKDYLNSMYFEIKALEKGEVRVKYLDILNLEELGWKEGKLKNTFIKENLNNKDYEYILIFHENENKYSINVKSIKQDKLEYNSAVFYGIIKNFNELQKIMQQLQII